MIKKSNDKNYPIISVIMSAYNSENTIVEAIESIICQSYKNWELIICDDGSTDSTVQVIQKYIQKIDSIYLIKNDINRGLAYSLNRCLEMSKGSIIARMDADDISDCDRLKVQVKYLLESQYDLIGTSLVQFNSKGLVRHVQNKQLPNKRDILYKVPFSHPTVMTYKYIYDKLNGYCETGFTRYYAQDYELWFRFFRNHFIGYNLDKPLYKYRLKENNQTKIDLNYQWNLIKLKFKSMKGMGYKTYDYIKLFFWHFLVFLKSLVVRVL